MELRHYTARQRGIKFGRVPFIVKLCVVFAVAVMGLNMIVVWWMYPASTSPVKAAIPAEPDKPVVWVYAKAVSCYIITMQYDCMHGVPIVLVFCVQTQVRTHTTAILKNAHLLLL